jgi:hypothetical protein
VHSSGKMIFAGNRIVTEGVNPRTVWQS